MHKHDQEPTVLKDGIHGYETKDVKGSRVVISLGILTVVTVLCVVAVTWLFTRWESKPSIADRPPTPVEPARVLPPLPRLQPIPALDLAQFHKDEDAVLNTYGWVDQTAGVVRIPVNKALELVAQRGLPYGRDAHVPGTSQTPGATPAVPAPPPLAGGTP